MHKGVVFDIQEFCVHDGPGPRVTVFFKGCPMRCRWCHNPEGLLKEPELMRSAACKHCGLCAGAQELLLKGEYAAIPRLCPNGFLKVAGKEYDATALANELLRYRDSLNAMGGGITLSGGECLLQSEFAAELLACISGVHRAVETAGNVPEADFLRVLPHAELVLYDLKLMDSKKHRAWTGTGNERILHNLSLLIASCVPFIVRVPLIPGVNDDEANLTAAARRIAGAPGLVRAELLPYNVNAGAKYGMLGKKFGFDASQSAAGGYEAENAFKKYDIPCIVQ